ncbi:MAG: response regulator [Chloroflexota bacterium]
MPSSILLVATDPAAAGAMSKLLTGLGHTVTPQADPAAAVASVAEHQLVIIDVASTEPTGVDVCRAIRATPALASVPVLCVSPADDIEERIRFLEAGADDVIPRPFDNRELEARVEALMLRFRRTLDRAGSIIADGSISATVRIVAVFSPKGGVGTTTIAANVALASALRRPDRVAIVDLALPFGSVATHLNLPVRQTLADLVRDESAMQEPEILRSYATRHDSGLHVLAAPGSPEMAELIETAHIAPLLATALGTYDALVVDAGSSISDRAMAVLERADSILVPLVPEIASLKAVHALLEYLTGSGSVPGKMSFVLNNTFAREILRQRDVESSLGMRLALELPYDPFVYLKAVNEGIPVVQGAPRSQAAERLGQLSAMAFGENGVGPGDAPAKKGRLGGILRR